MSHIITMNLKCERGENFRNLVCEAVAIFLNLVYEKEKELGPQVEHPRMRTKYPTLPPALLTCDTVTIVILALH